MADTDPADGDEVDGAAADATEHEAATQRAARPSEASRIERAADADAVLFDMDGVLVDSERYWHEFEEEFAFTEAVEEGRPDREETTGMNYREIYDYVEEEYGTTVPKEEWVDRYNERAGCVYGEDVELLDGASDLFDALREDGKRIAIISSAPVDWIDIARERFSLGSFDLVLSAEDIDQPGKPEPHIYEFAAAELDLAPGRCVVVEDSHNGVLSAIAAGCYTVGIRRDHNADTDLSDADEVVESPAELRRTLLGE